MAQYSCPVCPTDCTALLPTCNFTECNPVTNAGQVTDVLIGKPGFPMADWTDAAEWTTRKSCTGVLDTNIRHWFTTGAYARPEQTISKLAHGIKKAGNKTFKMTVIIDQTNQDNLDMVRQLECGGKLLMWFVIGGSVMFGGDSGIEVSVFPFVTAPDNTEEFMKIEIDVEWTASCSPETAANIIPDTYSA